MEPIYPLRALQAGGGGVLQDAEASIVRLTVDGYGRYVFAAEAALEGYVQRRIEDARYEQELIDTIERGLEDVEAGRLVPAEESWARLRALRSRTGAGPIPESAAEKGAIGDDADDSE